MAGPGRGDRIARWLVAPLALALAAILTVFFWLNAATIVDGPSMLPSLRHGDRLLVTRGYATPRRGDVVVFTRGEGAGATDVVKRVVGLPGDHVRVVRDETTVNGVREARAPWRQPGGFGDAAVQYEGTVPSGTVFVLGDNRPVSLDSRYLGPVPLDSVKGRATWIFSPVTRVRRVP